MVAVMKEHKSESKRLDFCLALVQKYVGLFNEL